MISIRSVFDIESVEDFELNERKLFESGCKCKGEELCSPEDASDIWEKKRYSICSKCPCYKELTKKVRWDKSYMPDRMDFLIEMQRSFTQVCLNPKYKFHNHIDFYRGLEENRLHIKK